MTDNITPNNTQHYSTDGDPMPTKIRRTSGKPTASQTSNPKGASHKKRLYSWDELRTLPPPEWYIDGILPKGSFSILYGPPGSGKTFVALDWILQRASAGQHVVYIAGEGIGGLSKRINAWLSKNGKSNEALATLLLHPSAIDMCSNSGVSEFLDLFQDLPSPQFVVIDTLARCFGGGDENSTQDMGTFVANCDKLRGYWRECTLLVLHHTGKDTQKGSRGSSALNGAVDCAMSLTPKGTCMTLNCNKMKDAKPFSMKSFSLKRIEESCVVIEVAAGSTASKQAKSVGRAHEELEKLAASTGRDVRLSVWRRRCYGKLTTSQKPETVRKAFDRAKADLLKEGRITIDKKIVRLVKADGGAVQDTPL